MRLRLLLATLLAPLLLWIALPLVSSADPQQELDRVERRIDQKRGELARVRGKERVLTTDIAAFTRRIDALQANVTELQRRQDAIQRQLDVKRAELERTQRELRAVRARLARLRTRLAHARRVLAARLVEIYKSGERDVVSVVLDANGFAELLENGAYLRRIGEQDRRIISNVRAAKEEAEETTRRLSRLEERQRTITLTIQRQRDEVARAREEVVRKRDEVARARAGKRELLRRVRTHAHEINEDLDALRAQEARIQARIRAAQAPSTPPASSSPGSIAPGPIRGGGRFIWPVNGVLTSSFGWRTSPVTRFHQGIDIGAPEGTPIRAGGAGTVIIAGYNGGYGNFTCLDHGGGVSTCYAHQSAIHVGVGQRVSQGQVIGLVGNTGFSTGAHLHFEVRVNGAATNPLSYLG